MENTPYSQRVKHQNWICQKAQTGSWAMWEEAWQGTDLTGKTQYTSQRHHPCPHGPGLTWGTSRWCGLQGSAVRTASLGDHLLWGGQPPGHHVMRMCPVWGTANSQQACGGGRAEAQPSDGLALVRLEQRHSPQCPTPDPQELVKCWSTNWAQKLTCQGCMWPWESRTESLSKRGEKMSSGFEPGKYN